jgi:hypothetical protein
MKAVVAGPDRGIEAALRELGAETTRVEGVPTGETLRTAGIADADLYVLTDTAEATSVSVAKDENPPVRVVVYSPDTIPEYARGQVDFAIAPDALDPETVAEELTTS